MDCVQVLITIAITGIIVRHLGSVVAGVSCGVFVSIRIVEDERVLIAVIPDTGNIVTGSGKRVQQDVGIGVVDFRARLFKRGRPVNVG
ncbi:hypothetical protein ES703_105042 [subsurface metagenome]